MKFYKFSHHRKASRGFIVVAVLWMLAALATLAAIYALYVNVTAFALVDYDDRLEAQGPAMAGVELAVYELTASVRGQPSQGRFDFKLGRADVAVDFRSENGRVDLNFAPKELLIGLFTALGANRGDAEGYAERIIRWRTPPTSATGNNEELFASADRPSTARRAPFQHVNEIGLVQGLPADLIDRALPYLTVYSGQGEINVFSAPPEVLTALPGVTPERVQVVLSQREGASQDILKAQFGMAAQYVTVQPGRTNRVTVAVRSGNLRLQSEVVVILLEGGTEPFRVLSWRDRIGEQ